MFERLDALSIPGDPAKANEDAFETAAESAVVLDGATGLGENLLPGPSDAAWLAQFGARRLLAHRRDGDTPRKALRRALIDAQTSFAGLRRRAPAETWEIPFASMMFAARAQTGIEALWFGDCGAIAKRPDEAAEVIGEGFARRAAESARVAKLAAEKGIAPAAGTSRAEYLPALRAARNRVNTKTGGYLFGPDPRASAHVAVKRVAAPPGTLILIASDGFLALSGDYRRYDADGLIAAAETKGLAVLGEELRAIEAADSEGRAYPRFKKSDDATAVLLRVA